MDYTFGTPEVAPDAFDNCFLPLRSRTAERFLKQLKLDSATGPDAVGTRVLKYCAQSLAVPVALLARNALEQQCWPACWKEHWLLPLYKKRSVFDPGNYRGVHLTSQVAKVVERLLGIHLEKFFVVSGAFGPNQFAYRKTFGYKDALALSTLAWLWNFSLSRKTGV